MNAERRNDSKPGFARGPWACGLVTALFALAACKSTPGAPPSPATNDSNRAVAGSSSEISVHSGAAIANLKPDQLATKISVGSSMDDCPRTERAYQIRAAVQEDLKILRKPNLIGVPFAIPRNKDIRSLNGFYAENRLGIALPAQFEVLSRWGGGARNCDYPIRWAYAWVKGELTPSSRAYLTLKHSPQQDIALGPELKIEDVDKTLRIETGPARFTILKRKFNGLRKVEIQTAQGWETLAQTPLDKRSGFLVERKSQLFSTQSAPRTQVIVERQGPLLASIAIKTHYTQADGKPLYGLTTRLHFFAGTSSVQIDHTYYNGDTVTNAPTGAHNRTLTDRVFFQLPLGFEARELQVRANQKTHRLGASTDAAIIQHKRSPQKLNQVYTVSRGSEDLEVGYAANRPYLAVKGERHWALATIAYLQARDPQGLRYDHKHNALELDWQSEELFVGGARGIWSRAVLDFGSSDEDIDLAANQAYAHANRPLIAAPAIEDLNQTSAWPLLAYRRPKAELQIVDDMIDKLHEKTVYYLQNYRITGTQIWPDLPRYSCILENDCAYTESNYYDGGENNYWDWSLPELEAFLRTADPAFLHDFALPEAFLMAETISWRPDVTKQAGLNFAGFSPCYGSARGYEGPYMEGLNQRRDRCPGDYSYNRVHKLAYILTADRRFTDFFSQAAVSVVDYYALPIAPRPGEWRELSSSRFTNQMLEQLLNGAEFGLIGGDKKAQAYLKHARGIFDYMKDTSLQGGHACILAGSGVSDPRLNKECESDQAWMLPLLLDFTTRLYALTQHRPIKEWLRQHERTSRQYYMSAPASQPPDFGKRNAAWVTTYMCKVDDSGIQSRSCTPARDIENGGRFYNGDYVSYLNSFALIFSAVPELRSSICSWLPYTYAQSLRLLDRNETNAMVWGKYPGKIFADAQKTLGAIESCE